MYSSGYAISSEAGVTVPAVFDGEPFGEDDKDNNGPTVIRFKDGNDVYTHEFSDENREKAASLILDLASKGFAKSADRKADEVAKAKEKFHSDKS